MSRLTNTMCQYIISAKHDRVGKTSRKNHMQMLIRECVTGQGSSIAFKMPLVWYAGL